MTVDRARINQASRLAIKTFGPRYQLAKLAEEAAECCAATLQYRDGRIPIEQWAGECTDDFITLLHAKNIMGSDIWEEALEKSLTKLERRIAEKKQ